MLNSVTYILLLLVFSHEILTTFAFLLPPSPFLSSSSILRSSSSSDDVTNFTGSDAPKIINVGVIGCGRIGLVHLAAISKCQGVKVTYVSNPTISKAKNAAEEYSVPNYTSSASELIQSPLVDAVWICSPSSFHASQIKESALYKKHVFCEKPIATSLPETVEAINSCSEAGVKLMIGLQRRFDPNFLRVKQAIDDKEVGVPIIVKVCSRDPSPPPFSYVENGGGIFADMAVHDLDMTRFLVGEDPVSILATGSCHIDKSIEGLEGAEKYDTANCIVKYPNGVTAMIDVCRQSSYGYDQRAEVLGTGGMVMTENVYPSTAKIFKPSFTGNADMPYDFFLKRYNEAYVRETEEFCKALVEDREAPCTGEDGLVALVMSIAAGISAEEGRWVRFDEVVSRVFCEKGGSQCSMLAMSDAFPEGFKPTQDIGDLLTENADKPKKEGFLKRLGLNV
ncbi:hypothetical protein TrVE_jg11009 [Triparma verrucosa]|uniref:Inositol 2-dehydrogenase n=1 Tax=Triparma verrucosa TaxID=1606542 RepID=A0A9W7C0F5_9STRA|nr:hypothetical protein TrVE_jg11009 [Triparma verrucosa]